MNQWPRRKLLILNIRIRKSRETVPLRRYMINLGALEKAKQKKKASQK
jgi:hypothetical protein